MKYDVVLRKNLSSNSERTVLEHKVLAFERPKEFDKDNCSLIENLCIGCLGDHSQPSDSSSICNYLVCSKDSTRSNSTCVSILSETDGVQGSQDTKEGKPCDEVGRIGEPRVRRRSKKNAIKRHYGEFTEAANCSSPRVEESYHEENEGKSYVCVTASASGRTPGDLNITPCNEVAGKSQGLPAANINVNSPEESSKKMIKVIVKMKAQDVKVDSANSKSNPPDIVGNDTVGCQSKVLYFASKSSSIENKQNYENYKQKNIISKFSLKSEENNGDMCLPSKLSGNYPSKFTIYEQQAGFKKSIIYEDSPIETGRCISFPNSTSSREALNSEKIKEPLHKLPSKVTISCASMTPGNKNTLGNCSNRDIQEVHVRLPKETIENSTLQKDVELETLGKYSKLCHDKEASYFASEPIFSKISSDTAKESCVESSSYPDVPFVHNKQNFDVQNKKSVLSFTTSVSECVRRKSSALLKHKTTSDNKRVIQVNTRNSSQFPRQYEKEYFRQSEPLWIYNVDSDISCRDFITSGSFSCYIKLSPKSVDKMSSEPLMMNDPYKELSLSGPNNGENYMTNRNSGLESTEKVYRRVSALGGGSSHYHASSQTGTPLGTSAALQIKGEDSKVSACSRNDFSKETTVIKSHNSQLEIFSKLPESRNLKISTHCESPEYILPSATQLNSTHEKADNCSALKLENLQQQKRGENEEEKSELTRSIKEVEDFHSFGTRHQSWPVELMYGNGSTDSDSESGTLTAESGTLTASEFSDNYVSDEDDNFFESDNGFSKNVMSINSEEHGPKNWKNLHLQNEVESVNLPAIKEIKKDPGCTKGKEVVGYDLYSKEINKVSGCIKGKEAVGFDLYSKEVNKVSGCIKGKEAVGYDLYSKEVNEVSGCIKGKEAVGYDLYSKEVNKVSGCIKGKEALGYDLCSKEVNKVSGCIKGEEAVGYDLYSKEVNKVSGCTKGKEAVAYDLNSKEVNNVSGCIKGKEAVGYDIYSKEVNKVSGCTKGKEAVAYDLNSKEVNNVSGCIKGKEAVGYDIYSKEVNKVSGCTKGKEAVAYDLNSKEVNNVSGCIKGKEAVGYDIYSKEVNKVSGCTKGKEDIGFDLYSNLIEKLYGPDINIQKSKSALDVSQGLDNASDCKENVGVFVKKSNVNFGNLCDSGEGPSNEHQESVSVSISEEGGFTSQVLNYPSDQKILFDAIGLRCNIEQLVLGNLQRDHNFLKILGKGSLSDAGRNGRSQKHYPWRLISYHAIKHRSRGVIEENSELKRLYPYKLKELTVVLEDIRKSFPQLSSPRSSVFVGSCGNEINCKRKSILKPTSRTLFSDHTYCRKDKSTAVTLNEIPMDKTKFSKHLVNCSKTDNSHSNVNRRTQLNGIKSALPHCSKEVIRENTGKERSSHPVIAEARDIQLNKAVTTKREVFENIENTPLGSTSRNALKSLKSQVVELPTEQPYKGCRDGGSLSVGSRQEEKAVTIIDLKSEGCQSYSERSRKNILVNKDKERENVVTNKCDQMGISRSQDTMDGNSQRECCVVVRQLKESQDGNMGERMSCENNSIVGKKSQEEENIMKRGCLEEKNRVESYPEKRACMVERTSYKENHMVKDFPNICQVPGTLNRTLKFVNQIDVYEVSHKDDSDCSNSCQDPDMVKHTLKFVNQSDVSEMSHKDNIVSADSCQELDIVKTTLKIANQSDVSEVSQKGNSVSTNSCQDPDMVKHTLKFANESDVSEVSQKGKSVSINSCQDPDMVKHTLKFANESDVSKVSHKDNSDCTNSCQDPDMVKHTLKFANESDVSEESHRDTSDCTNSCQDPDMVKQTLKFVNQIVSEVSHKDDSDCTNSCQDPDMVKHTLKVVNQSDVSEESHKDNSDCTNSCQDPDMVKHTLKFANESDVSEESHRDTSDCTNSCQDPYMVKQTLKFVNQIVSEVSHKDDSDCTNSCQDPDMVKHTLKVVNQSDVSEESHKDDSDCTNSCQDPDMVKHTLKFANESDVSEESHRDTSVCTNSCQDPDMVKHTLKFVNRIVSEVSHKDDSDCTNSCQDPDMVKHTLKVVNQSDVSEESHKDNSDCINSCQDPDMVKHTLKFANESDVSEESHRDTSVCTNSCQDPDMVKHTLKFVNGIVSEVSHKDDSDCTNSCQDPDMVKHTLKVVNQSDVSEESHKDNSDCTNSCQDPDMVKHTLKFANESDVSEESHRNTSVCTNSCQDPDIVKHTLKFVNRIVSEVSHKDDSDCTNSCQDPDMVKHTLKFVNESDVSEESHKDNIVSTNSCQELDITRNSLKIANESDVSEESHKDDSDCTNSCQDSDMVKHNLKFANQSDVSEVSDKVDNDCTNSCKITKKMSVNSNRCIHEKVKTFSGTNNFNISGVDPFFNVFENVCQDDIPDFTRDPFVQVRSNHIETAEKFIREKRKWKFLNPVVLLDRIPYLKYRGSFCHHENSDNKYQSKDQNKNSDISKVDFTHKGGDTRRGNCAEADEKGSQMTNVNKSAPTSVVAVFLWKSQKQQSKDVIEHNKSDKSTRTGNKEKPKIDVLCLSTDSHKGSVSTTSNSIGDHLEHSSESSYSNDTLIQLNDESRGADNIDSVIKTSKLSSIVLTNNEGSSKSHLGKNGIADTADSFNKIDFRGNESSRKNIDKVQSNDLDRDSHVSPKSTTVSTGSEDSAEFDAVCNKIASKGDCINNHDSTYRCPVTKRKLVNNNSCGFKRKVFESKGDVRSTETNSSVKTLKSACCVEIPNVSGGSPVQLKNNQSQSVDFPQSNKKIHLKPVVQLEQIPSSKLKGILNYRLQLQKRTYDFSSGNYSAKVNDSKQNKHADIGNTSCGGSAAIEIRDKLERQAPHGASVCVENNSSSCTTGKERSENDSFRTSKGIKTRSGISSEGRGSSQEFSSQDMLSHSKLTNKDDTVKGLRKVRKGDMVNETKCLMENITGRTFNDPPKLDNGLQKSYPSNVRRGSSEEPISTSVGSVSLCVSIGVSTSDDDHVPEVDHKKDHCFYFSRNDPVSNNSCYKSSIQKRVTSSTKTLGNIQTDDPVRSLESSSLNGLSDTPLNFSHKIGDTKSGIFGEEDRKDSQITNINSYTQSSVVAEKSEKQLSDNFVSRSESDKTTCTGDKEEPKIDDLCAGKDIHMKSVSTTSKSTGIYLERSCQSSFANDTLNQLSYESRGADNINDNIDSVIKTNKHLYNVSTSNEGSKSHLGKNGIANTADYFNEIILRGNGSSCKNVDKVLNNDSDRDIHVSPRSTSTSTGSEDSAEFNAVCNKIVSKGDCINNHDFTYRRPVTKRNLVNNSNCGFKRKVFESEGDVRSAQTNSSVKTLKSACCVEIPNVNGGSPPQLQNNQSQSVDFLQSNKRIRLNPIVQLERIPNSMLKGILNYGPQSGNYSAKVNDSKQNKHADIRNTSCDGSAAIEICDKVERQSPVGASVCFENDSSSYTTGKGRSENDSFSTSKSFKTRSLTTSEVRGSSQDMLSHSKLTKKDDNTVKERESDSVSRTKGLIDITSRTINNPPKSVSGLQNGYSCNVRPGSARESTSTLVGSNNVRVFNGVSTSDDVPVVKRKDNINLSHKCPIDNNFCNICSIQKRGDHCTKELGSVQTDDPVRPFENYSLDELSDIPHVPVENNRIESVSFSQDKNRRVCLDPIVRVERVENFKPRYTSHLQESTVNKYKNHLPKQNSGVNMLDNCTKVHKTKMMKYDIMNGVNIKSRECIEESICRDVDQMNSKLGMTASHQVPSNYKCNSQGGNEKPVEMSRTQNKAHDRILNVDDDIDGNSLNMIEPMKNFDQSLRNFKKPFISKPLNQESNSSSKCLLTENKFGKDGRPMHTNNEVSKEDELPSYAKVPNEDMLLKKSSCKSVDSSGDLSVFSTENDRPLESVLDGNSAVNVKSRFSLDGKNYVREGNILKSCGRNERTDLRFVPPNGLHNHSDKRKNIIPTSSVSDSFVVNGYVDKDHAQDKEERSHENMKICSPKRREFRCKAEQIKRTPLASFQPYVCIHRTNNITACNYVCPGCGKIFHHKTRFRHHKKFLCKGRDNENYYGCRVCSSVLEPPELQTHNSFTSESQDDIVYRKTPASRNFLMNTLRQVRLHFELGGGSKQAKMSGSDSDTVSGTQIKEFRAERMSVGDLDGISRPKTKELRAVRYHSSRYLEAWRWCMKSRELENLPCKTAETNSQQIPANSANKKLESRNVPCKTVETDSQPLSDGLRKNLLESKKVPYKIVEMGSQPISTGSIGKDIIGSLISDAKEVHCQNRLKDLQGIQTLLPNEKNTGAIDVQGRENLTGSREIRGTRETPDLLLTHSPSTSNEASMIPIAQNINDNVSLASKKKNNDGCNVTTLQGRENAITCDVQASNFKTPVGKRKYPDPERLPLMMGKAHISKFDDNLGTVTGSSITNVQTESMSHEDSSTSVLPVIVNVYSTNSSVSPVGCSTGINDISLPNTRKPDICAQLLPIHKISSDWNVTDTGDHEIVNCNNSSVSDLLENSSLLFGADNSSEESELLRFKEEQDLSIKDDSEYIKEEQEVFIKNYLEYSVPFILPSSIGSFKYECASPGPKTTYYVPEYPIEKRDLSFQEKELAQEILGSRTSRVIDLMEGCTVSLRDVAYSSEERASESDTRHISEKLRSRSKMRRCDERFIESSKRLTRRVRRMTGRVMHSSVGSSAGVNQRQSEWEKKSKSSSVNTRKVNNNRKNSSFNYNRK